MSRRQAITRRGVIQAAAGGLAVGALGRPARAAANGRIRCGIIGMGGRGMGHLSMLMNMEGIDVPAVCDIEAARVAMAVEALTKAGRPRPDGYGEKGPDDYRRMLERKDLDAVVVATPVPEHARMSIDALNAGMAVLSEVGAAVTLDECWGLVHAASRSKKLYMLAENVCYYRECMAVLNMVRQGVFGPITFGECGYVHDCRFLDFKPDGSLAWRGQMGFDHNGNIYPTHAVGPLAQWMDINRSDRFVSLVSVSSRQAGITRYAEKKFGPDSPQAKMPFRKGDMNICLIRTANGALVEVRYDTSSSRPLHSTTIHGLQGEKAAYQSTTGEIWIEGRSEKYAWEPFSKYLGGFDHEDWKRHEKEAMKTGHGGADFFTVKAFLDALRSGGPSPIDACDAATWSAITPLSAESIRKGGAPVEFPDFRKPTTT